MFSEFIMNICLSCTLASSGGKGLKGWRILAFIMLLSVFRENHQNIEKELRTQSIPLGLIKLFILKAKKMLTAKKATHAVKERNPGKN